MSRGNVTMLLANFVVESKNSLKIILEYSEKINNNKCFTKKLKSFS